MKKAKTKKVKSTEVVGEAVNEVKKEKVGKDLTKSVKIAQKKLEGYLTENKLDPTKDYSKDKKHGKKIAELVAIINVAQGKVTDAAPKEEVRKKPRKGTASAGGPKKYDYPLVDGKEMTTDEKKRYRQKQRSLASGNGDKATNKKVEDKKPEAKTEEVKKDKKKKVSKEEPKAEVKKKKLDKKKKVSKDED